MAPRDFKKVVTRLNTKNSDVVRDYYLNLEETMFAYGEYTMKYMIESTTPAGYQRSSTIYTRRQSRGSRKTCGRRETTASQIGNRSKAKVREGS